jgi:hypothetical protein
MQAGVAENLLDRSITGLVGRVEPIEGGLEGPSASVSTTTWPTHSAMAGSQGWKLRAVAPSGRVVSVARM